MPLIVRPTRPEEAAAVVELIRELARNEGEESAVTPSQVTDYLAVAGNGILLAELDGDIVGLISYSIRPNLYHGAASCLIEELFVCQQARGMGIGRRLAEDLVSHCTALRCAEISVSTMPDNQRAIEFYRTMGFSDEALFLERHLQE